MKFARKAVGVIDEVENVHAHDAVERLRGDIVRLREVGDEGRVRIIGAQIEDVDSRRSSSAEPSHTPGIVELQATAADPVSVGFEEPVDIIPVNGYSTLVSEGSAYRLNTSSQQHTTAGHAKPSP